MMTVQSTTCEVGALLVPRWAGPATVHALFTTRWRPVGDDGTDASSREPMDLGPAIVADTDDARGIAASRQVLRAHLPSAPVFVAQVHGRAVITVDPSNLATVQVTPPTADALVTRLPDVPLVIRTADCLPVLLTDRAGSVLGVAHAGWRGLADGVLEATVSAMMVPAGEIVAWIGPAIGPRAFEVGPDVHARFCTADPDAREFFTPLREGKWLADLPGLARLRLMCAGIASVSDSGLCTFTDAGRFHSWRRDQSARRMALVAWIEAESGRCSEPRR